MGSLGVMRLPRHRCRLVIVAEYHQFYVWDPVTSGRNAPEDWSEQDIANRAKLASGVVVVCPVRDTEVPVEVGIWDEEPQVVFALWQHVVEAPLITTGLIEIDECCGAPKASFSVDPGDYTVRALYRGLDKLSEDGFEGDDFYEIQIRKSPCAGFRVIKRWD